MLFVSLMLPRWPLFDGQAARSSADDRYAYERDFPNPPLRGFLYMCHVGHALRCWRAASRLSLL